MEESNDTEQHFSGYFPKGNQTLEYMKHIKSKNSDLESVEINSKKDIQKINEYIQQERTKS